MTERLKIYRAEARRNEPTGVLFGRDDRGRAMFVLADRWTVLDVGSRLETTGRPVDFWTREARRLPS